MNLEYEKELEARIDHELKALPPLPAPASLMPRVISALAEHATVPWYRRSWQTWPMPLQAASMLTLLAAFAGFCFVSWHVIHTPAVASATTEVSGWFSLLSAFGRTLSVLLNAVALAFKSLGSAVVVGGIVALLLGYAMFVGMGTVYMRLAFARR